MMSSDELATPHMRATIPYVDTFLHMNSAAGSLADQAVHDAITGHLDFEAQCGNTEARIAVADQIDAAYKDLSRLARVPCDSLSLADGHTTAWQTALQAVPLNAGDRVLVGESEWGGNLSALWQRCRLTGAELGVVASEPSGALDARALERALDDRVKIVCATWVPAVNGVVNDVEQIAAALEGHPAWLFIDAAQAFCNTVVDLSHPRADVVTVSGRKYLRGPRGTGFAAYSPRFLDQVEPPGVDQHSGPWQDANGPALLPGARRFEFMETSFAVRLGLAAAIRVALSRDLEADMSHIRQMATRMREALARLPDVTVQDTGTMLSGIVTFSHDRLSPVAIKDALRARKINIAAPPMPYGPLWFSAERPPVARLSPHAFNTSRDVDQTIHAISRL